MGKLGWGDEKCLDILLPKLQGQAGDYVFDELSQKECSNYKVLVKFLKHRFCKIEIAKRYATIFWKTDQKASKTEEPYVTKLHCIYGKAYPQCGNAAWDADLLHRFSNGLLDWKACHHIELVKDPVDADDALDELSGNISVRRSGKRAYQVMLHKSCSHKCSTQWDIRYIRQYWWRWW